MTAPTTLSTGLLTGLRVDGKTYQAVEHALGRDLRRGTAPVAETFSRVNATMAAQTNTTAQSYYTAVQLAAGDVITTITFSAIGAGATLTAQFAGLYSAALAKLVVSADSGAATVTANTEVAFTLSAPYTVPSDGLYYVMLASVGSSLATWAGVTGNATINARTPASAFTDSAHAISNLASAPAVATNSAGANALYAVLS